MDSLSVLTSVNKVALFFFFLVLGFVIYEFVMYLRENRKFVKPSVPQFNPNGIASNTFTTVASPLKKTQMESSHKKNRLLPLLISTMILILLGGLVLFYVPSTSSTPTRLTDEKPAILAEGIGIYTPDWNEIPTTKLSEYKNKLVFITLKNKGGTNIDKARIRVNAIDWATNQETLLFNKELNLYYIQYVIASNSARLDIQGQLHDTQYGWPE